MALRLGGLQRTSTLDFPGVLCCVVFTAGCDLDCFYCHNRALIDGTAEIVSEADVMDFLRRRRGKLDGVVISGGEPTLQPELADFLRTVRGLGFHTKLDTNGQRPEVIEGLLTQGLLDYAALDIKATEAEYPGVCGGEWAPVARTAALLAASGISYQVRTTLYPGLSMTGLRAILAALPPQPRWGLNFFRRPEQYRPRDALRLRAPALTATQIEAEADVLRAIQPALLW